MPTLYSAVGCKFYIGAAIDDDEDLAEDLTAADYSGETWTQIKNWTNMGAIGDVAQLITQQLLDRKRDVKVKGTRNAGSMENVFARKRGDAGQTALIAAEKSDLNYAFKIAYNDMPSGGTSPTLAYFYGLVMNASHAASAANDVRNLNSTIEINSNLVFVDAT